LSHAPTHPNLRHRGERARYRSESARHHPRHRLCGTDGDAPEAKANVDWAAALLRAGRQSAIVTLPPGPSASPRSDGSPAAYDPDTWLLRGGEGATAVPLATAADVLAPELACWGHNDTAKQLPALMALVRSDDLPEVMPSEGMNRSIA